MAYMCTNFIDTVTSEESLPHVLVKIEIGTYWELSNFVCEFMVSNYSYLDKNDNHICSTCTFV